MKRLKQLIADHGANLSLLLVSPETLRSAVHEHGDALGTLTAFHHAANSLALEAGVIGSHVAHGDPVTQSGYFLQLIADAELRLKRVLVGYEKLRAAAIPVLDVDDRGFGSSDFAALEGLQEALDHDLK